MGLVLEEKSIIFRILRIVMIVTDLYVVLSPPGFGGIRAHRRNTIPKTVSTRAARRRNISLRIRG